MGCVRELNVPPYCKNRNPLIASLWIWSGDGENVCQKFYQLSLRLGVKHLLSDCPEIMTSRSHKLVSVTENDNSPFVAETVQFFAAGWNDWHQHHRCDRAMPPFSPMSSAKKADLIESGHQLTVITSCITYISLASIYFNSQCINVVQRASCVINVLTACKNFRNLIAQCQQIAMVHSFPASNV